MRVLAELWFWKADANIKKYCLLLEENGHLSIGAVAEFTENNKESIFKFSLKQKHDPRILDQ